MSGSDRRVLTLAVHPDDETLGAGGTLLSLKQSGAWLGWLCVTGMSTEYGWPAERVASRRQEIDLITNKYAFDETRHLDLRPAGLDQYPLADLVSAIRETIDAWRPETVILPFWDDAHSDHQVAFRAAKACLKKFRAPYLRRVYAMEVLSETNFAFPGQFKPQVYSDISDTLDGKVAAMRLYESELHAHPFPRSEEAIRALATLRGSESGFRAAEAFELIAAYDGLN